MGNNGGEQPSFYDELIDSAVDLIDTTVETTKSAKDSVVDAHDSVTTAAADAIEDAIGPYDKLKEAIDELSDAPEVIKDRLANMTKEDMGSGLMRDALEQADSYHDAAESAGSETGE